MDFLTQVSTPLNFNGTLGPSREPYNLQDKKYPIMLIWVRKYLHREKVQLIYALIKGLKTGFQGTDKRYLPTLV